MGTHDAGRKGDQALQRNARLLGQDCQERGYGRLLQGSLLQRSPWYRWSPRPRHVRRAQEDHRCFHRLETPFVKKRKENKHTLIFLPLRHYNKRKTNRERPDWASARNKAKFSL